MFRYLHYLYPVSYTHLDVYKRQGFPINEKGEIVGTICVSGLKHNEDHQLIVDTLMTLLKEENL